MKKNIAILAALGIATLTACGSKTDANEKNFGAAMNQYFEESDDLCLNVKRWPVDLSEMDLRLQKTMQAGRANQMAALEAAGLVNGADTEVDIMGIMGRPMGAKAKIKRYTLTDAAKPFVQEKVPASIGLNGKPDEKQTHLCWGKKALDKVVKWEGPMKLGDYQEARITYTYKVNNLADWAKRPEVQAAFPEVKITLDRAGSQEYRRTLKLTNRGWED